MFAIITLTGTVTTLLQASLSLHWSAPRAWPLLVHDLAPEWCASKNLQKRHCQCPYIRPEFTQQPEFETSSESESYSVAKLCPTFLNRMIYCIVSV